MDSVAPPQEERRQAAQQLAAQQLAAQQRAVPQQAALRRAAWPPAVLHWEVLQRVEWPLALPASSAVQVPRTEARQELPLLGTTATAAAAAAFTDAPGGGRVSSLSRR